MFLCSVWLYTHSPTAKLPVVGSNESQGQGFRYHPLTYNSVCGMARDRRSSILCTKKVNEKKYWKNTSGVIWKQDLREVWESIMEATEMVIVECEEITEIGGNWKRKKSSRTTTGVCLTQSFRFKKGGLLPPMGEQGNRCSPETVRVRLTQ